MLPFLARDHQGVTSLIAVCNSSKCNDIKLKLEVKDERGAVVSSVGDFWLRSGHVKLIDLASIDSPSAGPWSFGPGTKGSGHSGVPGFVGAGVVEVTDVQQLCDTDGDGDVDQEPIMPSLVVVNKDTGPGDVTSVYEGIPVNRAIAPHWQPTEKPPGLLWWPFGIHPAWMLVGGERPREGW